MESSISAYFTGKNLPGLKKSITPNWGSTNNQVRLLNIPDCGKLLEVGCGIGRILAELYDRGKIVYGIGVDASEDMIREGVKYVGNRPIEFKLSDGDRLPQLSCRFNHALSFLCFQHIPNTDTIMRYIAGMMAALLPNGQITFQVLDRDYHPDRPLWTFHPFHLLADCLKENGATDITIQLYEKWAIFRAIKENGTDRNTYGGRL